MVRGQSEQSSCRHSPAHQLPWGTAPHGPSHSAHPAAVVSAWGVGLQPQKGPAMRALGDGQPQRSQLCLPGATGEALQFVKKNKIHSNSQLGKDCFPDINKFLRVGGFCSLQKGTCPPGGKMGRQTYSHSIASTGTELGRRKGCALWVRAARGCSHPRM